jgi:hypothetical protein
MNFIYLFLYFDSRRSNWAFLKNLCLVRELEWTVEMYRLSEKITH